MARKQVTRHDRRREGEVRAMPNPRRRHSPARKGHDRAHKKLAEKRYAECPHCHAVKVPHRICPSCGYYKDRAYIVKVES